MSSQGQKLIEAQMAAYQPDSFAFTDANLKTAKKTIAKYPKGKQQSALMPLLTLAQRQHANWLPVAAMDYVADLLEIPHMRAYEVATFYTMYNLAPVGRYMIEVCTTTPCWLRGSDDIVKTCQKELGIGLGETSADGLFTLKEAECLAACVNAPMAQIGDHYYEDLDADSIRKIIADLRAGHAPKTGSMIRHSCEPCRGVTTLKDMAKAAAKPENKVAGKKHADDKPNKPSQDAPKAKPKDVRSPAVDKNPTTEKATKGKKQSMDKGAAKTAPASVAKKPAAKAKPKTKK
jgi:NADH dehydrogenase (ubiquinone) flavoprotein 2